MQMYDRKFTKFAQSMRPLVNVDLFAVNFAKNDPKDLLLKIPNKLEFWECVESGEQV